METKRSGKVFSSVKVQSSIQQHTLISVWDACWCLFMRLTRGETKGLVTLVALLVKGRTWRAIAPLSCFDICDAVYVICVGVNGMTRSKEARDQRGMQSGIR